MGKYLIQDIVPPQRKRPTVKKKTDELVHPHAETHHAKAPVHHPAVAHTGAHRTSHAHIDDVDMHHAGVEQDPHTMIVDQLEQKDDTEREEIHNPPLALTDEILGGGEVAGAWPYNNNEHSPISVHSDMLSFHKNPPPQFSQTSRTKEESKGGSWLPWILGPLALVAATVFILNFFSGATITLIAKESTTPMEQTFTAMKDKAGSELSYAVMKVELSDTDEVPATGTKTVTTKAVGKIIIYNEQITVQRLIKNTRFQSTAGKIYRINESITVPKAVTKSGKTTLGSIEVTIYADEAGAEYNSDPTDFTVPGLKNTPQAKMVYARSKGVIAGGASGTTKSVSDQDLKKAGDDLRVSLETKLRNKAHGDLAPSQVTYDQGILIDLKDPVLSTEKATSDDKAVVTETGTLYMVVFDRALLTKAIAKAVVPTYGGEEVALNNIESLTFGAEDFTSDRLWNDTKIDFTLKGTPELRWVIDQEAIKSELLGLAKSDFNAKMAAYPTVERAKASLRPFWKQHFPTDPKAITIKIVEQITD
jgi:hypothetical protein